MRVGRAVGGDGAAALPTSVPGFATTTSHATSRALPEPSAARAVHAMCWPTPPVLLIVIVGPFSVTLHDLVLSIDLAGAVDLEALVVDQLRAR